MILVILGIGIVVLLVGVILINCSRDCWFDIGNVLGVIGGIVVAVALIFTLIFSYCCFDVATVDERIAMYQEENAIIETQIAEVVAQYQQYELDIFTEVTPDSSITLVSLYPELKSDTLVASQIEVYIKNNEAIKALKVESIKANQYNWWLYFGS